MSGQTLWDSFCERFGVIESSVPLFAMTANGLVQTRKIGKDGRQVLLRSPEMEALIIRETRTLLDDWRTGTHRYDGLIYFMGWRRGGHFVPLYIGKAETLGKGKGNLSANIRGIENDRSKFARWGDNYAYHVGDLSACVLGHDAAKRTIKYQSWAETLFKTVPCKAPTLLEPVYFWARAWDNSWTGVWEELGATRLAFLEYLLIGVGSLVSPALLNREGLQRTRQPTEAECSAGAHIPLRP